MHLYMPITSATLLCFGVYNKDLGFVALHKIQGGGGGMLVAVNCATQRNKLDFSSIYKSKTFSSILERIRLLFSLVTSPPTSKLVRFCLIRKHDVGNLHFCLAVFRCIIIGPNSLNISNVVFVCFM